MDISIEVKGVKVEMQVQAEKGDPSTGVPDSVEVIKVSENEFNLTTDDIVNNYLDLVWDELDFLKFESETDEKIREWEWRDGS